MFKKILIFLISTSVQCPEKTLETNIFSDSVNQVIKKSEGMIDLVFTFQNLSEEKENMTFLKRSFRSKTLLEKLNKSSALDTVGISGGVFLKEADKTLSLYVLGQGEDGLLESAPVSPNQIITVAASLKMIKTFFTKDEKTVFFDPVIREIQDSFLVESFPQLQQKTLVVNTKQVLDLQETDKVRTTAKAVCFRYMENKK